MAEDPNHRSVLTVDSSSASDTGDPGLLSILTLVTLDSCHSCSLQLVRIVLEAIANHIWGGAGGGGAWVSSPPPTSRPRVVLITAFLVS